MAGIGGGSIVRVPWEVSVRPAASDPRDEEFEDSIFGRWTQDGNWSAGDLELFGVADFGTNGPASYFDGKWRSYWNTKRPSWLMVQQSMNGAGVSAYRRFMWKEVAMEENVTIYYRGSTTSSGPMNDNDGQPAISLWDGGNKELRMMIRKNIGGGTNVAVDYTSTGIAGLAEVFRVDLGANPFGGRFNHGSIGAIVKRGGSFAFYLGDEGGNWKTLYTPGNSIYAPAGGFNPVPLARIGLWAGAAQVGQAAGFLGLPVAGFDYVRFIPARDKDNAAVIASGHLLP